MEYIYTPKGVCSMQMIFQIDNNIIKSLKIVGGCPGNTIGVSRLVVGKTVDEVIEIIEAHDSVGAIFRELRRRNERNYEIYVRVKLCHMPPETVARQFHTTSNNVNNIVMRTKRWLMKEYDRNSDL